MKVTVFGGVCEIGGNKILVEDGGSALLLDFGLPMGRFNSFFDEFVRPRTSNHLLDVARLGLVPEIDGIYRNDMLANAVRWHAASSMGVPPEAERMYRLDCANYDDHIASSGSPRVQAVLLTHAHADHYGQIGYLDQRIPIVCSPVTRILCEAIQAVSPASPDSEIYEVRAKSVGTSSDRATFPEAPSRVNDRDPQVRPYQLLDAHAPTQIGAFSVEAIPVDHSLAGCCAFLIRGPSGRTLFYTGDVRFHGLYSLGPNSISERLRGRTTDLRPDILITEGTRITDATTDDESDVRRRLHEVVSSTPGLAIVDWAWKDTARFQTVASVAKETGRILCANPKLLALWSTLSAHDPNEFPPLDTLGDIRAYLERSDTLTYSPADYQASPHKLGPFLRWDLDDKELARRAWESRNSGGLIGCSQLEYLTNAVRAYDIARDPSKYILQAGYFDIQELIDIDPPPGSVYVRAATEPFSDEMRLDEAKLKNWLQRFGVIASDEQFPRTHVSGHASGTDLLEWIREMRPSNVIPVHTEHPEVFTNELSGTAVIPPTYGETLDF